MNKQGTIYIVGTPIGNLGDITYRAVETLKSVDIILAEDTRHTLKLLNYLEISKHLISYHKHNEIEKMDKIIELLDAGKNIALVSDAGMPIISDPGQNLIKKLVDLKYNIEVIPGVTALITAIVKSGMDSTRFVFEGFLSIKKKQRIARLKSLKDETRTVIFYEAPHKLLSTLKDMQEYFGNRKICIARELTKIHEEYNYTCVNDAIKKVEENGIKGEIVLLVEGICVETDTSNESIDLSNADIKELVKNEMKNGLDKKEAIKKIAKALSVNKNEVYKECIEM